MDNIKIGDKLEIHCYKHNGKLHRQWDEAVVLDIKDNYIVFGNNKTTVVDSDGRVWNTKEPAILFFFKCMLKYPWSVPISQTLAPGGTREAIVLSRTLNLFITCLQSIC